MSLTHIQKSRASVYLKSDFYEQLTILASGLDISLSALIEQTLKKALEPELTAENLAKFEEASKVRRDINGRKLRKIHEAKLKLRELKKRLPLNFQERGLRW